MSSRLLEAESKPQQTKTKPNNNVRKILVFDTIFQPENLKLDPARKCISELKNMEKNKIYHISIFASNLNKTTRNKIRDVMVNNENMNDVVIIMYRILCSSRIMRRITKFDESSWEMKDREEVKLTSSLFPKNTYCIDAHITSSLHFVQKYGYCKISLRIYRKKLIN